MWHQMAVGVKLVHSATNMEKFKLRLACIDGFCIIVRTDLEFDESQTEAEKCSTESVCRGYELQY
jgi:hypothetical protein